MRLFHTFSEQILCYKQVSMIAFTSFIRSTNVLQAGTAKLHRRHGWSSPVLVMVQAHILKSKQQDGKEDKQQH